MDSRLNYGDRFNLGGNGAPKNTSSEIPGLHKKGTLKEESLMTSEMIQKALDNAASNHGPKDIVFQSQLGISPYKVQDFSHLSDDELTKTYFENFNQEEFVGHLDILITEMGASQSVGMQKNIMIQNMIAGICRVIDMQMDRRENDTTLSYRKKQTFRSLSNAFKASFVKRLEERLEKE